MSMERIPAPTGGMNTEAAPEYIPLQQCRYLENLIPGEGKVWGRGGISRKFPSGPIGTSSGAFSAWIDANKILFREGSGGHRLIDPQAGTNTSVSPGGAISTVGALERCSRVVDYVYGAADTAIVGASHALGRWDTTANTITTYTSGPTNFTDIKGHLTRLFVLSGSKPGGAPATIKTTSLFYSILGGPATNVAADWIDPTSGLVNEIVIPTNDKPVGLAKCGRFLAVLFKRSIWLLTGETSAAFAVRLVLADVGCIDNRSIVENEHGFYFMSERGYAFYDGSQFRIISDSIRTPLITGNNATTPLKYRAAILPTGQVMVVKTDTTMAKSTCFVSDSTRDAWWLFTSRLFTASTQDFFAADMLGNCPRSIWRTTDYAVAYDGVNAYDISNIGRWASSAVDTGTTSYTYGDASNRRIPAVYLTRFARLSGPVDNVQVRRVMVDWNGYEANMVPVTLDVRDGQNATLLPTPIAFAASTGSVWNYRRRYQGPVYASTDTIQLRLAMEDASSTFDFFSLEFHDAYLEYETAALRPTIQ